MKSQFFIVLITIVVHVLCMPDRTSAQNKTTAGDRSSVDLTIYNQDLALIREDRTIRLPRGLSYVVVPEIPATIDGTSLYFRSLTDPRSVRVLEQNYQYDLVHQEKLLQKYIGKEVEFVRLDEESKKEYTVKGKILATGYAAQPAFGGGFQTYVSVGGMVAEINGKIEINPTGRLVLPALPEGLILRPQLEWLVTSGKEGVHKVEISYLARQLSWSSNYVAVLDRSDSKLDLTGWVTVTNNSGTTFHDAGLKLVAGDVNQVKDQFQHEAMLARSATTMNGEGPQFEQKDLFEYKLYTLQRKTDLNNNETKQIELATAKDVSAKKIFVYDGMADSWRSYANNLSYRSQGGFGQQSNPKVGVFVTMRNDERLGLGIPLPKGKVRVYKRSDDGKEEFIGEDLIDHTPKNEEIRLYLGNAFDLVGSRVQKDFRSFNAGRMVEETIEIKIRNHKKEQVEVQVYEHPWRWSNWEILRSNVEWEKIDQGTLKFPVVVGKDGEKVITYTIRYSW